MSPPQSRLYLKLTHVDGDKDYMACVEAALQAGDVAALLIGAGFGAALKDGAKGLLAVSHANDVALIIDQDVQLAQQLGADGVQVAGNMPAYNAARATLGDDKIIGVSADVNRHSAMELAEAGAAYVSFADDPSDPESLSAWWAHVMEVPCVLHLSGHDDEVVNAALAGIEFISPDETIWQSPEHAAQTVKSLNDLLMTAGAAA